jgi:hypothetical protein
MTMDDVEKAARALCAASCTGCGSYGTETFTCLDGWNECVPDAKAAIAALDIPAIKAAAYAQGREDAARVCEAERLLDPQDAGDEGYMQAISHCVAAIRATP